MNTICQIKRLKNQCLIGFAILFTLIAWEDSREVYFFDKSRRAEDMAERLHLATADRLTVVEGKEKIWVDSIKEHSKWIDSVAGEVQTLHSSIMPSAFKQERKRKK